MLSLEDAFSTYYHSSLRFLAANKSKAIALLPYLATLALLPVVLLNQMFAQPIQLAFTEFQESIQDFDYEIPSKMASASLRLIGYYGVIWVLISLCTVYYGAVLSSTITVFRQQQIPLFTKVLLEGTSLYKGFLVSVLAAVWKIFWKPMAAILACSIVSIILSMGFLYSFGFFLGIVLTFSGLYRYGLGPFIHLSTGIGGRDACGVSLAYYHENRKMVTTLFVALLFLPFLVVLLLLMAITGMVLNPTVSSILLWVVQSLLQFTIIMTLINFAMNTFQDPKGISDESASEADILQ